MVSIIILLYIALYVNTCYITVQTVSRSTDQSDTGLYSFSIIVQVSTIASMRRIICSEKKKVRHNYIAIYL